MLITEQKLTQNKQWSQGSLFVKSLIIRGIGYRAYYVINDLENIKSHEFQFTKYLVIRAGHTVDLYLGVPRSLNIKINKKDRKLVIMGPSKSTVSSFSKAIIDYRKPSVYTGRGVRLKGSVILRKVGKKDKQKGKAF